MYPAEIPLLINGQWRTPSGNMYDDVIDPSTGRQIGKVARVTPADLHESAEAAELAFKQWRHTPAHTRYKALRAAAGMMRSRSNVIADLLTQEQGKPIRESRAEILLGAEVIDWLAEEARRIHWRLIPARRTHIEQIAIKEPIGPVAAFAPWNFPINQSVRKVAAALATGCTVILKAPEEAPASSMEMVKCFLDAGLPPATITLVFGPPAMVSDVLIGHPSIRKVSFTGSTPVGRLIASRAGSFLKPMTLELGGHAPAIICSDADLSAAIPALCAAKFLNAGQVCTAPTRFMVHHSVRDRFLSKFLAEMAQISVGPGQLSESTMGPLINQKRLAEVHELVRDAIQHGAKVLTGGSKLDRPGFFYRPTVLCDVPTAARIMNEEPFGPVALINGFEHLDEAIAEANRLPYGLAAYAYTRSYGVASQIKCSIEAGMISLNHNGLSLPETPFGGVKASGYGSEGGSEAIEAYVVTKFVSHAHPVRSRF